MAGKDYRRGHPDFTPSEAPAPERRRGLGGVRIPPVKAPEPEPERVKVEHSEQKLVAAPQDPWVQRIAAATVLVGAISAAGWGGVKISERDVPSASEAKELTQALKGCQRDVVSLKRHVQEIEEQAKKRDEVAALHSEELLAHSHVIYLLNGRVAPIWRWPEARSDDWISGTDNLHRHVQRGGQYPGKK